jgi:hypothetical protein
MPLTDTDDDDAPLVKQQSHKHSQRSDRTMTANVAEKQVMNTDCDDADTSPLPKVLLFYSQNTLYSTLTFTPAMFSFASHLQKHRRIPRHHPLSTKLSGLFPHHLSWSTTRDAI